MEFTKFRPGWQHERADFIAARPVCAHRIGRSSRKGRVQQKDPEGNKTEKHRRQETVRLYSRADSVLRADVCLKDEQFSAAVSVSLLPSSAFISGLATAAQPFTTSASWHSASSSLPHDPGDRHVAQESSPLVEPALTWLVSRNRTRLHVVEIGSARPACVCLVVLI